MVSNKTVNLAKQKTKFLEYYRELPIQKLAADSIGKNEDTIINWKNADSDFADQIGTARAEWAREKANKAKSVEWLLERIMNDHFAAKIDKENGVSAELERVMQFVRDTLAKKD